MVRWNQYYSKGVGLIDKALFDIPTNTYSLLSTTERFFTLVYSSKYR